MVLELPGTVHDAKSVGNDDRKHFEGVRWVGPLDRALAALKKWNSTFIECFPLFYRKVLMQP